MTPQPRGRPLRTLTMVLALTAMLAAPLARDATAQNPRQQAAMHTTRGDTARAGRNFQEALAEYILAYAYDPAPERLINIGHAYESMGQRDVALELFKRVVAVARRGPAADQANARIAALGGGGSPGAQPAAAGGGSLTVMTVPPGGVIWVDGVRRGQSPMAPITLGPGAHQVVVQLDGYQSWGKTVMIGAGQTVTEMATLMVGTGGPQPSAPTATAQGTIMTIQNVPAGASVMVNDSPVPVANGTATAQVSPGPYTVVVRKPGLADFIQMITVQPGQSPTVLVQMNVPSPGGVGAPPSTQPVAAPSGSLAGSWYGAQFATSAVWTKTSTYLLELSGQGSRVSGTMIMRTEEPLRGYKRRQCNNAELAVWETRYNVGFVGTQGGGRLQGLGGVQTSCTCESICSSSGKIDLNVFVSPSMQVMATEDTVFQRRNTEQPPAQVLQPRVDVSRLNGRWLVRTGGVDVDNKAFLELSVAGGRVSGRMSLQKLTQLGWRKRDCGNRDEITATYHFDVSGSVSGGNVELSFDNASPAYSDCPCKPEVCEATTASVKVSSEQLQMTLDGNHLVNAKMLVSRQ